MATMVQEQPQTVQPRHARNVWTADRAVLLGVLALAVAVAVPLYGWFWENSRDLWYWIVHDRNTHYGHGLDLAMDLRHGNLPGLLHHLDGLRVWGPLHSILSASIQLLFGPDYRLAIVPSWLAWIGSAVFGFLLARRMAPRGGNMAGLVTALFILVSPAHRAYATDIMLESLGACLSLLCLYLYLVVVQDERPRRGLWLGLALTALFLHKYNYWLLVAMGIGLAELTRQPLIYWFQVKEGYRRAAMDGLGSPSHILLRQLRNPLTYLFLGLLGVSVWIGVTGGINLRLGHTDISITKPHNAMHLAYVVLFIRGIQLWRSAAVRAYWQSLPQVFRQAVGLHGLVIAVNFLLPQRLANFVYFLSPTNDDQHRAKTGFLHGAPFYLETMMDDYHVAGWSLFLMAGLLGAALLTWRNWRAGSGAVFWFLLVSAFLTFQHPMLKSRFMHSWIAAEWVFAGVGLAAAVQLLACKRAWFVPALGIVGLMFIGAHSPYLLEPGHSPEGGIDANKLCTLPVVEAYLPSLSEARNPALLSNMPIRDLQAWSYQQAFGRQRFNVDIKKLGADVSTQRGVLENWFKSMTNDMVVLVEIAPDSRHFSKTTENRDMATLRTMMNEQTSFRQEMDRELPDVKVRVTVWRRAMAGS